MANHHKNISHNKNAAAKTSNHLVSCIQMVVEKEKDFGDHTLCGMIEKEEKIKRGGEER